jgi:glutamate/tyrosine decarboxylase-like PLP-dependent enzyme
VSLPPAPVLDLDPDTMRELGRRVVDVVAEHLSTLRDQRAFTTISRAEADSLIAAPPSEQPIPFDQLLRTLQQCVFPYAAREPHPGFVAYVPSCPSYPAILGDWLATGFNFFAGVWSVAAGPNAVEALVLDWFRRWLDMPAGAGGLLTSGGSAATLTALLAAREHVVAGQPARLPKLTVYLSDQTHSAAIRGAWIAGVPRSHVRVLPSDDEFRIPMEALVTAIAADRRAGLIPLAVVANAGTTNTGATDPLDRLADLCERERIWLHVDAAYGGFAVLTDRATPPLRAVGRADSVAIDPHKWLFVPFECGCVMMRDPEKLRAAFQILPDYLQDTAGDSEQVNFADRGEQLTRCARAIKVWLGVQYYGMATLRAAIEGGIERAELAEELVRASAALEVTAPARLGVLCFRVHPANMDDERALEALNERVNAAINERGRFFISSTRLRGIFTLRICPIGHRTTNEDIRELVRAVEAEAGV